MNKRTIRLAWSMGWLVFLGWLAGSVLGQSNPLHRPPAPGPVEGPPTLLLQPHPAEATTPSPKEETSLGRKEPAVTLEWIGPSTVRLGQPVVYQLVVKNTSASALQNVIIRHPLSAGVALQATEPPAATDGQSLTWELGSLEPRQEKRIKLHLVPSAKGDIDCQAQVTFTGSSLARMKVREPKLALRVAAPERILLGESATIALTISNPGDGPADKVKVTAILPEGLEHPRGREVELELGNLALNESRNFQLICQAKADGRQRCEIVAVADGNLNAREVVHVNVVLPRLDLTIGGPKLRHVDRPVTYVLQVTNPNTSPVSNVTVTEQVPMGFKFVSASAGGQHDPASRTVTWFVGDLMPNQSHEVSIQLQAMTPGEHRHRASAVAGRGLKTEAETVTRVEGLSALLMELADLNDPVEVGAETAYEIRITNTGSKTETNLQLVCTIPDKMELLAARSTGKVSHRVEGQELVFEPLPRLAPRADVVYRVQVRGTAPGDLRFRARITADGLTDPVLKEESTKVYGE